MKYWILMADIVNSKQAVGKNLAVKFEKLVLYLNEAFATEISSPLTITLGDEFQGVIKSEDAGKRIILAAEEWLYRQEEIIQLRYVLHYGIIDTPINRNIAHGMLGAGLADARKRLNDMKNDRDRFWIKGSMQDDIVNKYWILYQSITDDWNLKDRQLAADFLELGDYKAVAARQKKDTSLMWRRNHSLKIREINILKTLLTGLTI